MLYCQQVQQVEEQLEGVKDERNQLNSDLQVLNEQFEMVQEERNKLSSDLQKELEAHREKEQTLQAQVADQDQLQWKVDNLMKQVSTLVPARFLKCLDV